MTEPTYKGPNYEWFYNTATGLGEIQAAPGVLADRPVSIALQREEAKQFNAAKPEAHGVMIKHQYEILKRKRAARRA